MMAPPPPRRMRTFYILVSTLSLSLLACCAPSPPQFSLDRPCEKTFQCVRSSERYPSTLNSANCLELIEDTIQNHLSDSSRRNHPENTWLIPPPIPLPDKNDNEDHPQSTCRIGLFCTNVPRASPEKINSTLLALHAALTSPTDDQQHDDCSSAAAASLNIIAPPPPSSLYGWLPSPAPVLAEPNHCGVWFMTGQYFDGELGVDFEPGEGSESERWRESDDVASVAVGRGVIYREVDGREEEEQ